MAWFTKQAAKGTQLAILFSIGPPRVYSLHTNPSPSLPLLRYSCHRRIRSTSSPPSSQSVPLPSAARNSIRLKSVSSSSQFDPLPNMANNSGSEFKNIYTFRFIVHTRVLSRMKIYQTLVTMGALPPALVLHNSGALSSPGLASLFGVASLATVMLYIMSGLFRRVVGMVGINDKEDKVRISHLTFWGRREDIDFELSSVVPLSDMAAKANDIYQIVQFYDRPVKFYWFFRHAQKADLEAIERVFGRFF